MPRTPHLLYMVIQKIKQPAGLVVLQTRKIIKTSEIPDQQNVESEPSIPSPEPGPATLSVDEKLIYSPPDRMREEILGPDFTGFTVESEAGFIKVFNGRTVAVEKSPFDFYTDILLFRDYEILEQKMVTQGVDTEKVAFRRYGERICYVVGQPGEKGMPFSSLWVEKDTFFPVRYILVKGGWAMEFRYGNWQQVSQTWYPMETDIFMDGRLVAEIRVSRVDLASGLSSALFDLQGIEKAYPGKENVSPDHKIQDLDRQLEEFKQLYE